MGCDGHGVRWQGAKKYNNQSVVVVARHAVWSPRCEVARSKKITINQWWWWQWQDMWCDSQPWREVARSQKIATINRPMAGCALCWPRRVWPGAKKIKQSTGSGGGRMCTVLATASGGQPKKYNNQLAVVVTVVAIHVVCWPRCEVARSQRNDNQPVVAVAGHAVWLPRHEVARSQKIAIINWPMAGCVLCWPRHVWPGAKKIEQSTGSGGGRMCAVLATV